MIVDRELTGAFIVLFHEEDFVFCGLCQRRKGCEEKVVFSRPQQFRSVHIDGPSPFMLMDRGEGADNNIKGIEMDWYYNIITGSLKNFPFNFVRGCSSSSSSSVDLHSAMNYMLWGWLYVFPFNLNDQSIHK